MQINLSLRSVYIGLDICYIFLNYISQIHDRERLWIIKLDADTNYHEIRWTLKSRM